MHPIIPQMIDSAAVVLFLLSYQLKSRKNIIICNVSSRILYILQYLLLGAISGAALDVLGSVASVIAERKSSPFVKRHIRAVFFAVNFTIITVGIGIAVINKSLLDLFPVAGVLLHTGAFWLTDERAIRRISLIGSPFWLVYNLLSRAYGSALGDALTICSIIIAMIKYLKKSAAPQKNDSV